MVLPLPDACGCRLFFAAGVCVCFIMSAVQASPDRRWCMAHVVAGVAVSAAVP